MLTHSEDTALPYLQDQQITAEKALRSDTLHFAKATLVTAVKSALVHRLLPCWMAAIALDMR